MPDPYAEQAALYAHMTAQAAAGYTIDTVMVLRGSTDQPWSRPVHSVYDDLADAHRKAREAHHANQLAQLRDQLAFWDRYAGGPYAEPHPAPNLLGPWKPPQPASPANRKERRRKRARR